MLLERATSDHKSLNSNSKEITMNYDFRLKNQSNKLSSRLITSTGAPQEMLSGSSARPGRMHRFRNDLRSILKGRADFLASIDLSAIINHPSAMDQN